MFESQGTAFCRISKFYGFKLEAQETIFRCISKLYGLTSRVIGSAKFSKRPTSPSSVETASLDGGSKSSSRTTSSAFDLPTSHQSSSRDDEPVHAVVEVVTSSDPWISLESTTSTDKTRMGPNSTTSGYHQISCLQAGLMTQAVFRSFPRYFPRISTLCRVPYLQR